MKITKDFLMKNRTPNKAWNKKQFEAIGITWPPLKGWMNTVIGKELNEVQVQHFLIENYVK